MSYGKVLFGGVSQKSCRETSNPFGVAVTVKVMSVVLDTALQCMLFIRFYQLNVST